MADVYPVSAGKFRFSIDGVQVGSFSEVSGLEVSLDLHEIKEGGRNGGALRVPNGLSWPNLRLKRGITESSALFDWFSQVTTEADLGKPISMRSSSLELTDEAGEIVRSWAMVDVMPVKWTGPTFGAGSSEIAVEELEIAHGGFSAQ